MLKSGLRPEFNLTQVLDFEMFTNARVCLFDVILIVMKWIMVQVLGINFAGTNFAYLPVLSKVFRFTFLCCFCYIVVMFVYKCSAFWLREILKS